MLTSAFIQQFLVAGIVLAAAGHLAWRTRKYLWGDAAKESGCASGCGSCAKGKPQPATFMQLGRTPRSN